MSFFRKLKRDKFIHLSYQDFIENTERFSNKIFEFLKLEINDEFLELISQNIKRQNNKLLKQKIKNY